MLDSARIVMLAAAMAVMPSLKAWHVWNPDNGDGTFTNPILWGDWADHDNGFKARFYYSYDGKTFCDVGETCDLGLGLPWIANRFALFCYSATPEGENGYADFDWFRFSGK